MEEVLLQKVMKEKEQRSGLSFRLKDEGHPERIKIAVKIRLPDIIPLFTRGSGSGFVVVEILIC